MNHQFILDFETLGQSVFKAPLLNCAFYIFDWDRFTSSKPYTFEELVSNIEFYKFDIQEQVKSGRSFKKSDYQWWMDQGPEAKKQLKPTEQDGSVKDFLTYLKNLLKEKKVKTWWSRANCFDPVLLQREFDEIFSNDELNEILPFWGLRDIRTYIDTRFNFENKRNGFCPIDDEEEWKKIFVKHNSIHDVAADILRLQKVERAIHCED